MVEAGFQSDNHMLMFPAGLNSRKQPDGSIRDLPWKKTFISKSVEYQRDVVPIHFSGQNSERFYRIARFSDKYLPFNLAMLFLVDEMYRNVGKDFRIAFGKPIPADLRQEQDSHRMGAICKRQSLRIIESYIIDYGRRYNPANRQGLVEE